MRADLLVGIGVVELGQQRKIAHEIARHGPLRVEQRARQVFGIFDERMQARSRHRHEQHPVLRSAGRCGGLPVAEQRQPTRIEIAFATGVREADTPPAAIKKEAERVMRSVVRCARDIIDAAVELTHADLPARRKRKAKRKRLVVGAANVEQAMRLVVAFAPGAETRGVVEPGRQTVGREREQRHYAPLDPRKS